MRECLSERESALLDSMKVTPKQREYLTKLWLSKADEGESTPTGGGTMLLGRLAVFFSGPLVILCNALVLLGVSLPVALDNMAKFVFYVMLVAIPMFLALVYGICLYASKEYPEKYGALDFSLVNMFGVKSRFGHTRAYLLAVMVWLVVSFVCLGQFGNALLFIGAMASLSFVSFSWRRNIQEAFAKIEIEPASDSSAGE